MCRNNCQPVLSTYPAILGAVIFAIPHRIAQNHTESLHIKHYTSIMLSANIIMLVDPGMISQSQKSSVQSK
jgi:hypothetical protein